MIEFPQSSFPTAIQTNNITFIVVVLMGFQVSGTKLYFQLQMSMAKNSLAFGYSRFSTFEFSRVFLLYKKVYVDQKIFKKFQKNLCLKLSET